MNCSNIFKLFWAAVFWRKRVFHKCLEKPITKERKKLLACIIKLKFARGSYVKTSQESIMPNLFILWPQQQKFQLLFKPVWQCFGLCTVHYIILVPGKFCRDDLLQHKKRLNLSESKYICFYIYIYVLYSSLQRFSYLF